MTRMFHFPEPDGGAEPARDERLGALLRDAVGVPAMTDGDWSALADRVSAAVRGRRAMPWWGHVGRWELRAIPLALAAALVGAFALWSATGAGVSDTFVASPDPVAAMVSGASSAEAARSYAGAVAGSSDLVSGVPE